MNKNTRLSGCFYMALGEGTKRLYLVRIRWYISLQPERTKDGQGLIIDKTHVIHYKFPS